VIQPRDATAYHRYLSPLRKTKWIVYAKAPFAGPQPAIDYVGRHTHCVAISNNRLLDIEDGRVQFSYKDYRFSRGRNRIADRLPHHAPVHAMHLG
jgi:hypothetical protein